MPDRLLLRRYWTAAKHEPQSSNPYKNYTSRGQPLAPGDKYTIGALAVCDDLANANVFHQLAIARATARADAWVGGMSLTAIQMAVVQMLACYREVQNGSLSVLPGASGTSDGVSKMLYLRDSRRSMGGVGGFLLCHNIMSASDPGPGGAGSMAADQPGRSGNDTGYKFLDTAGLGARSLPLDSTYTHRNGAVYHATSAISYAIRTQHFRSSPLFELPP